LSNGNEKLSPKQLPGHDEQRAVEQMLKWQDVRVKII
jgi:hypothetical protein